MHGGRRHVEVLPQPVAEARGIQDGSGTDDPAGIQPADLPRGVREDIHWVRRHQEHPIEPIVHHVTDDLFEDLRVLRHQVQTRLTRLLRRTRAHHDQRGVPAVLVAADGHAGVVVRPRHGVVEVLNVPPRLPLVEVNNREVVGQPLVHDRVRVRHAHVPRPDEHDLAAQRCPACIGVFFIRRHT